MALKVIIEDSNANIVGEIDTISIESNQPNNISSYKETELYDDNVLSQTSNIGNKVFLLNESPLGDNYKFSSKYEGYISYVQSDSEGNVNGFYIYLTGKEIKRVKINFDGISNQYATKLVINGAILTNNNYSFDYELPSPQENVTIQITQWNTQNSYIKLTSITTTLTLEYNSKKGLQEVLRGSQMIDNNVSPDFGIISNYGTIKIIDKDQKIENLAEQDLLDSEKNVKIYFKDKLIGTYLTDTFTKEGNQVTIELNDKMLKLQNIIIDKYYISDQENANGVTPFTILNNKLEDNGFIFVDQTKTLIIEKLNEIGFKSRYIIKCSLWELMNKICQLIGMRIWLNENGLLEGVIL